MPRKNNKGRMRSKVKTYETRDIEREIKKSYIQSMKKEVGRIEPEDIQYPDFDIKDEELQESNFIEGLFTFIVLTGILAILLFIINMMK